MMTPWDGINRSSFRRLSGFTSEEPFSRRHVRSFTSRAIWTSTCRCATGPTRCALMPRNASTARRTHFDCRGRPWCLCARRMSRAGEFLGLALARGHVSTTICDTAVYQVTDKETRWLLRLRKWNEAQVLGPPVPALFHEEDLFDLFGLSYVPPTMRRLE